MRFRFREAARVAIRRIIAAAAIASLIPPAFAADKGAYAYSYVSAAETIQLGVGKTYLVDLPQDADEVLVADPKVANAVVRSARKAYLIGMALGETDIVFFDAAGQTIRRLAVSVGRDMTAVRTSLSTSLPHARLTVRPVGDSVIVAGSVRSAADAQTAVDIASNYAGAAKVINAIKIEDREQVLLKVSVVEMQRNVAKQFGVQWDIQSYGKTGLAFGSNPAAPFGGGGGTLLTEVPGQVLADPEYNAAGNGIGILHTWGAGALLANIEALESNNLLRTLAEPTLTAISGEKADFLAGGEFPIPIRDEDGIVIEYKKYGVSLAFTPIVLSDGRISLQIGTEVSEPSSVGTIVAGGFAVSGLTVRRANTTVELPSGGSIAMAGLLQDSSRQGFNGLPGLINLPVLGALFRSREYQRGQTELVVLVTPYLAKSVQEKKLATPDKGYSTPTDAETILLGRLNKVHPKAKSKTVEVKAYRGPIGHIVE
ncbi:type II and III secretion system protein family protein [Terrihabitans rhizophilus]|uniref:Type II and III secretion system protein family protein n=1 Tax=Terrihabitans rhizophilus TaxID=3092662 RepID=A0ABU4RI51_9HYPH|nr:type II and III secretion system protein family protein [Terrihabitans sp. PJ23]MDX6804509.1 type II and III secretion system protein family protein [Terrihabitans sp. PJ23]